MKTSKSTFQNAQIIFATVLTLVLLFAGCNETPNGTATSSWTQPQPQLEGVWLAIDQDGNIDYNNVLHLTQSTGFHQIFSNISDTYDLYMEFEYVKINGSILRINSVLHQIKGVGQATGITQDVYYSLNPDNTLRIFNQNFIRV